jgi:hypothetical protein
MSKKAIGRSLVLATVAGTMLLAVVASAAGAAEGERVLEPRHSLIGGCKEGEPDNVEDPGCPGGSHPPAGTFSDPRATTTDDYGNIYVSSFGTASSGSKGRIDVFCADGTFKSELAVSGPTSMAVDGEGNLYVMSLSLNQLLRFEPDAPYSPEGCEIGYGGAPPAVVKETAPIFAGLAINRDDDHLFGIFGNGGLIEFGSAEEGNPEIRVNKGNEAGGGVGVAVDAARDRMYANAGFVEERIDILDLNSVTAEDEYEVIGSILPASVPAGSLGSQVSIAVDEGTGNVFVLDGVHCVLYEFDEDGTYLQTIPAPFLQCGNTGLEIGVDNGPFSPNGKGSEEAGEGRFLYVPSNRTGIGHSYAFFVSTVGPPEVSSIAAANIGEDEAELRAQLDPNNLPTAYAFEYKAEGAEDWVLAGEGTLPTGNSAMEVSTPATGLSPGTRYLFRVIASNEKGADEAEASFATYPHVITEPEPCANALLRAGPSALLPDCRAYELVTPGDTNGRVPLGTRLVGGTFTMRMASPAGNRVPFLVEGGSLPGIGGIGPLAGDPYLATRGEAGWSTAYTGVSPGEATSGVPGGFSPDMGYSFYRAAGEGAAVLSPNTGYIRYPDGHFELLGQGSLGKIDPNAVAQWISEGGGHIVFNTETITVNGVVEPAVQLEPAAAPDGTGALYDRTVDGITHVVSLKPGGGSFGAGEPANFRGASPDGVGIAFEVGGVLYVRYANEETFTIGAGAKLAGFAEGGSRVFYLQGGNLKAFDVEGGVIDFTASGDVTPVTVAADGTAAFFISETAIAGSSPNPEGDSPQAGKQNLYRSLEGQIAFVATVTEGDVETAEEGLGLWVKSLLLPGAVPARSTPNGSTFLFKSRATLTGYHPDGHAEIYRYSVGSLQCLSCNPTGAPATEDAALQSVVREGGSPYLSFFSWPENLRADGRRAFFETSEALVATDSDGLQDVYEWEDQEVGSCRRPEGCVYLVSSPQSSRGEYLWGVSRSGDDVFFLSSELLVGADADPTPSIYDARVGGGFPEEAQAECEGEGCRPNQQQQPSQPTILTPILGQDVETGKSPRCPKGKHKIKRGGRVRCVKKKHRRGHGKHRATYEKKGGHR